MEWWDGWWKAANEVNENSNNNNKNVCIADITYFGITSWYMTFPVLCEYIFEVNAVNGVRSFVRPYVIGQNGLETTFGRVKRFVGHKGGMYGAVINKVRSQKQSELLFNKPAEKGTKKGHYKSRLQEVRRQINRR